MNQTSTSTENIIQCFAEAYAGNDGDDATQHILACLLADILNLTLCEAQELLDNN